jgi:hypothetical protein
MKKLMLAGLLSACLLGAPTAALAQTEEAKKTSSTGEFRTKLPNDKAQKVLLLIDGSRVRIEGYDGDELIIRAPHRTPPPERAKGLRPLYYNAEDNSGIGLAVTREGNTLRVTKASRYGGEYTIRLPKRVSLQYEQVNWGGGTIEASALMGDLEVKTNDGNIQLSNVTGPIVASSTSGSITVTYTSVEQSKPSAISNISGVIDITLPASTKGSLKLTSISGEIYSDLEVKMASGRENLTRLGGGNRIEGTLNGGGVEISLNTISSDIFVRKQK